MDIIETPEEVERRTNRFKQLSMGDIEPFSEDWYRAKYPMFPEEYFPIFAQFSETQKNNQSTN